LRNEVNRNNIVIRYNIVYAVLGELDMLIREQQLFESHNFDEEFLAQIELNLHNRLPLWLRLVMGNGRSVRGETEDWLVVISETGYSISK
jgi:hypothetical protein